MKAAIALIGLFLATPVPAFADIELSPLRQVITAEAPHAVFTVSNPSSRILEGRVSWIDLSATQTGYTPAAIEVRAGLSAAPYLTVSPAQFRLEPGARIQIRVNLKDGVTAPRGERRSHLLIETAAARTLIRKASASGLQTDISLGVSAPVILRRGAKAVAKLGETKLLRDKNGMLLLETTVEPGGAISTYGSVVVTYAAAGSREAPIVLGRRDNVAGYLDAGHRRLEIPLNKTVLAPGELQVRYLGGAEFEGRVFDQRGFDIAPAQ